MLTLKFLNFHHTKGIYDVVANLGALVARLVFSKVEESAYVYFNQSVNRGTKVDPKVAKNLGLILRTMLLFGLIVLTFGWSYSHLLLHLYGRIREKYLYFL